METAFHAARVPSKMALIANGVLRSGRAPHRATGIATHRESDTAALQDALPAMASALFRERRRTTDAP